MPLDLYADTCSFFGAAATGQRLGPSFARRTSENAVPANFAELPRTPLNKRLDPWRSYSSSSGSHTSSDHSMISSVGPFSCERTSPTPTLKESFSQR